MLKKKIHQFTVHFIPDKEGGFTVEVPVLPGCVSEGNTFEEAEKMIKEAIELYCETLIERGLPIPKNEDVDFLKAKIEVPISIKPKFQYAAK